MKYALFTAAILSVLLFWGCSSKRPVEAPVSTPKKTQIFPVTPPDKEIAMADIRILQEQKNEKILIVLDPGHGGKDFGTHSLGTPKYQEKFLNLSTTQMVKNFLQQLGYKVLMTRADDTFVALDKRSQIANDLNPKLFVSIHYNSAPSKEAEGVEVFYYDNEDDKIRTNSSKALAQSVLAKVIQNTNAKSRGVKHGNYAVLRETKKAPSILIEGGFLTSSNEMEKIKDATYLKKLALGITQGIDEFLNKKNPAGRQQD